MNEELLAASVKVAPYWSVIMVLSTFLQLSMLSQPKSAAHQQAAKLLLQYWRPFKRNYDLNSAFENADRLLEQAYRQPVSLYCATNIIKPTCVRISWKKYFKFINKS